MTSMLIPEPEQQLVRRCKMNAGLEDLEGSHGLGCLLATHDSSQMVLEVQRIRCALSWSHRGKIWRTQVAQQIELAT